jgi:hypothetical protein
VWHSYWISYLQKRNIENIFSKDWLINLLMLNITRKVWSLYSYLERVYKCIKMYGSFRAPFIIAQSGLSWYWLSYLGPLFFFLLKTFNHFAFQPFYFECTCRHLFQKRVELDIYVFIKCNIWAILHHKLFHEN